ncbi:MAG: 50S ribosomal protein L30 [Proteobacteria bacterium]|nr:50S ribosomal protein L30 [Pseudomonadota bacterium]
MTKKTKTEMKKVKLTLVKSVIGRLPKHKETVKHLGLRRMHQTVERELTPTLQGMVNKVSYLLKIEESN